MNIKNKHFLSPLKIGNIVLKNRMVASNCLPHYIQGPETFPAEPMIMHYANKAKSGAAVVTCAIEPRGDWPPPTADSLHYARIDINDAQCQNYLSQLADAIHFYDAKACIALMPAQFAGYDVVAGELRSFFSPPDAPPLIMKEITEEQMNKIADDYAKLAFMFKKMGFDMGSIHMAYRGPIGARFLSRLTNKRTDKYGGSIENRARFPLMIFDRVRKTCGEDFLLEGIISGAEPEGGNTIEDTIAFAKMAEGYIDILQLRAGDIDPAHPIGFTSTPEKPAPFIDYCEAVKASGARIVVEAIGGLQDVDLCEKYLRTGKADLMAMARSWISNPDYGIKVYEGRNDDVIPCIRCNKCHVDKTAGPFLSLCSVNPLIGFEHRVKQMIDASVNPKNVAVIGGGPAGMEAALVAKSRGHKVTLYEKRGVLGGQLKTSDWPSFKWPVKDYKNYLIWQVKKAGIIVKLNTEVTPKMIRAKKYDAVLVAVGGEPLVPDIPGTDSKEIFFAEHVYGKEASLGKNIVVVGGGEVGVETGMYLAENGHKVIVLEMRDKLAADAPPLHYYNMFREAWEKMENFSYILKAKCISIRPDGVSYIDADGAEKSIKADSVVIATGTKPRKDEALKFYGSGGRFYMIGDCNAPGNIQKSIRSAFSTASTL